jgi:hypothetical protein
VLADQGGTETTLQADEAVARSPGASAFINVDTGFDLPNGGQAATQVFRALEADAAGVEEI